ncbi:hypothetical protein cypCar_00032250 [Cyprinus carpio]|nr:hypothetical protein cypCar_00032250 [Cyprinus carpio]
MEFIKDESEDIKIEETFRVKHEDTEKQTKMVFENEDIKIEEAFRVKHEDTEEQTKMAFIKEESEDIKSEETFRVKHEDTEEQTKMEFIKEESEDMEIEEAFRVKCEDTETQTVVDGLSNILGQGTLSDVVMPSTILVIGDEMNWGASISQSPLCVVVVRLLVCSVHNGGFGVVFHYASVCLWYLAYLWVPGQFLECSSLIIAIIGVVLSF